MLDTEHVAVMALGEQVDATRRRSCLKAKWLVLAVSVVWGCDTGTAQAGTRAVAVRSAAEGQREPLVPAMAALPERRARLARRPRWFGRRPERRRPCRFGEVRRGPLRTGGSPRRCRPEEARETAARLGNEAPGSRWQRGHRFRRKWRWSGGAREAKEPEALLGSGGKAWQRQRREAEAPRELVA